MHERRHCYCGACHAAYMRANRTPWSQMSEDQRARSTARSKAHTYRKRGKIARMPCVDCGSPDVQMHHRDYSRPLEVTWLCDTCHRDRHANGEPVRGPLADFEEAPADRPEWVDRLLGRTGTTTTEP